ncbi:MAG: glycoside hydrolase family 5 protein [Ruminococcus sp.]|nr:glycoside hydrolase family 5 protein [Ruminococcus sp.]
MKKQLTSIFLAAAMALSAVGCGGADSSSGGEAADTPKEFHSAESAQAFVESMGVGWNLGNSLDPSNCTWVSDDMDYETAWGNPKVTKELIKSVHDKGFDTIRVPVTWSDHSEGDDHKIKAKWFDRVQEVVDWCIDEGFYVIVNIHHEDKWLTKASSDYDKTIKEYKDLWTQIADRFKNYDEHLILESMNEIGFDDIGVQKGCELMNKINGEFVDLVRKSGGNNDKRYLLLAGYWTDIDRTIEGGIKMPEGDDRTMLSVHYYSPSTFAIADLTSTWGYQETWGTDEEFDYLEGQMQKLKENYVDKGVPVIIGEYGATVKDKDLKSVVLYISSVMKSAREHNMCPILWDAGSCIDRETGEYKLEGLEAALADTISAADKAA